MVCPPKDILKTIYNVTSMPDIDVFSHLINVFVLNVKTHCKNHQSGHKMLERLPVGDNDPPNCELNASAVKQATAARNKNQISPICSYVKQWSRLSLRLHYSELDQISLQCLV